MLIMSLDQQNSENKFQSCESCFKILKIISHPVNPASKMNLKFTILSCLTFLCKAAIADTTDLVKYVNTLQGTNSEHKLTRGNTYPTTALPFGMHTWTPQTGRNGDGWKYQYAKDSIRGFQQAHQCSSWTNDYAVFSLMPVTGKLVVGEFERAAKFSHSNEIARPNYYKVTLANNITTEMAPTERGVHMRFTFPKKQSAYVVLDGYTRMSLVTINPAERKITGYVINGRNLQKDFKNYFVIIFDKPFVSYGT